MSLRPAPLKGRYRGRTSLLGLSPLVLFPLATGLLWAAVMLLLRLLPGSFVSRFLVPVSRLLSAPVKFVSSLLPFCLLELLLLGIPLSALGLLVWDLVRRKRAPARGQEADRSDEGFWALVSAALSVFFVMMTIFQLTLGVGYHTLTLEEQLGYPDTPVTAQSIADTAQLLAERAASLRSQADYEGRTVKGHGKQLREAYRTLGESFPVYRGYAARPKGALLSTVMSHLGVGGLYSPFTCEAVINTDCTPPSLPFTVAHEMSHSLLVAREEEANFSAFLACSSCDDAALQYSAYFMGLLYTCSAYYQADFEGYRTFYFSLDEGVRDDLIAYSEHVSGYDGWVSDLQSSINDILLKSNGQQQGVDSYGLMVNLLVAWQAAQ